MNKVNNMKKVDNMEKRKKSNLPRAWTVENMMNYRPKTIAFEGKWRASLGTPEYYGDILIFGTPKNGKTDFAVQLARYLTNFGRVLYNSCEEGMSASMQNTLRRNNMMGVRERFHLVCEDFDTLRLRLSKNRSANFVFIDSIQKMELSISQYRNLRESFPCKTFIFVSHIDNSRRPDGLTARTVRRYSDAVVYVNLFVATPVCRGGGGEPYVIWPEYAAKAGFGQPPAGVKDIPSLEIKNKQ